ncbi:MAG: sigma-70 family RNA polymerase sigma factor [Lachnospiraceae bacterium]|nr:sigma-70 family RNA polymerase sigma factor [Lachnospiraceae bacterium]
MNFFPGKDEKKKEQLVEETILKKYNSYYRLAYSYVHKESDAEDIVQNTAYKALRACRDLRQPEYVETWVYRILLNEIFRLLKQPENFSYEEFIEKTGNEGESVEDVYENVDLQRVIDSLPEKDKLVVELRFFEDKKLEDIALVLEENVNTVKSRLYRSLKKMRNMLEE